MEGALLSVKREGFEALRSGKLEVKNCSRVRGAVTNRQFHGAVS